MNLLGSLLRDVRHAVRLFVKNPGFVAIAVLSIGFGTGANVAIFSATDALLLRPLPVERSDELVTLGTTAQQGLQARVLASHPDVAEIRDRSRSFAGLAAFSTRVLSFASAADAVPRAQAVTFVNGDFFTDLHVRPALGRAFHRSEDVVARRDAVTILSYGVWQRDFAGAPSAIGRRVRISGIDFTVIGVLPETFTGLEPRYVRDTAYVPLAMLPAIVRSGDANPLVTRDLRIVHVKARLKPGVSVAAARAELAALSNDLTREHPTTNTRVSFTLQTELQTRLAEEPFDVGLVIVFNLLSLAVLGVACANVAGLLASRSTARSREIALRLAIGAGRGRIVGQLLVESFGIALAGSAFGIALGYAGIRILNQIKMPTDVFAYPEFRLDERALVFSLVMGVASAFLFGLAPAIQTARTDVIGSLKSHSSGSQTVRAPSMRSVLVASQVALSLVLLTIAASTFETFRRALDRGPGFRTSQRVKVTVDTGERRSERELVQFFDSALDNVRRLPGIANVTVTSAMPLFSFQPGSLVPEGYTLPPGEPAVKSMFNCVDEAYFSTMEIPIVSGRAFRAQDGPASPLVAIVNEVTAGHLWPGQPAVGRRFRLNGPQGPFVEVVGVARTAKYLYFLEPPTQMVYLPFRQNPRAQAVIVASTLAASPSMLPRLGDAIGQVDPDVPLSDAQTMESFYAARTTMFSVLALRLVGSMGFMGMVLTMVGLYGLVSFSANRRTREIGIRIAIGATAGRVIRLILGQGLRPAWCGLVAGLLLSAVAMRVLAALVPVESRYDRRADLVAVVVLVGVSVLAAYIPARRGSRVDPTVALRSE